MNNPREFDKVYTALIWSQGRQNVRTNVQYYFDGYPFLRNIKVKAISISDINASIVNESFISICNSKKNTVLFNVPTSDLDLSNEYPTAKLRLYNIDGVDLLNSYWIFTGSSFSWVSPTVIMKINFYY
jgi:hypothetical protein